MNKSAVSGELVSPPAKSVAPRSGGSNPRRARRQPTAPEKGRFEIAPSAAPSPSADTTAMRWVRFGCFKPEAGAVHVAGSFNGWDPKATPMVRDSFGGWSAELELPPGEYRYRLVVDGEWRDDSSAPQTVPNPFGGYDAVMVVG